MMKRLYSRVPESRPNSPLETFLSFASGTAFCATNDYEWSPYVGAPCEKFSSKLCYGGKLPWRPKRLEPRRTLRGRVAVTVCKWSASKRESRTAQAINFGINCLKVRTHSAKRHPHTGFGWCSTSINILIASPSRSSGQFAHCFAVHRILGDLCRLRPSFRAKWLRALCWCRDRYTIPTGSSPLLTSKSYSSLNLVDLLSFAFFNYSNACRSWPTMTWMPVLLRKGRPHKWPPVTSQTFPRKFFSEVFSEVFSEFS